MGKIHLKINDEIDKKFRATVGKKWGQQKGNLTKAMEEALEMWIAKN